MARRLLTGVLTVSLAACSSGSDELAPPPPPARKASYLKFTAYPGDLTAPGPQAPAAVAGTPVNLEVSIMAQDSAVIAVSETVTVALKGGTLWSGTTTRLAVNGVAKFTDLVIDSAAFTYQFTALASGLPSRTGPWFTVIPGPFASLTFYEQPADVFADQGIACEVTTWDAFGNQRTMGGDTVTLTLTSGPPGATLGGALTVVTASSGPYQTAVFGPLRLDKVGSGYTLTARSGNVSAVSHPFRVNPFLVFTVQPSQVPPATVMTPAVTVSALDGNNQPVPGVATSITLAMSGTQGTLGGTVTRGASTGVATFDDLVVSPYLGNFWLRATATGSVPIQDTASAWFAVRGKALQLWSGNASIWASADDGRLYWFVDPLARAPGDPAVTQFAVGGGFWCFLAAGGQASCWGANDVGQLGYGNTQGYDRPSPVAVSGGLSFSQLAAGQSHACGIAGGGVVHCWGSDSNGQIGDNPALPPCLVPPVDQTTYCTWTPVAVSGSLAFAQISAGALHTCGIATDGSTYCWGSNASGQLGDGTTTSRHSPTPVSGGLAFTSVFPSVAYTCALTAGGQAYCWGLNGDGELGDGTTTGRTTPVAVGGGLAFTQLTAGSYHTCGLTTAGQAYCWGLNASGQLGDGTNTSRSAPTAVAGALTFVQLAAMHHSTCGRTSSGQVWCWGDNGAGQLGDRTLVARNAPVRVTIF